KWLFYGNDRARAGVLVPALDVLVPLRGRWLGDIDRVGRRKGLFQALLQGGVEPALFLAFGQAGIDWGNYARSDHGNVLPSGMAPPKRYEKRHDKRCDSADAIWLTIQPC